MYITRYINGSVQLFNKKRLEMRMRNTKMHYTYICMYMRVWLCLI